MRCVWITACLIATLTGGVASRVAAQTNESREGGRAPDRQSDDSSSRGSVRELQSDPEYRLRYDDREDRLSIDVDEDIRVRDDRRRGEPQDYARDAEVDLRYDSDRHDLRAEGGGTIDVNQAANALANWWESWWEEEERARRSAREGMERGVRAFLRQHDDDGDGVVARRELPQSHRDEFSYVDRNRDGSLSASEVERFGADVYKLRRRPAPQRSSQTASGQRSDSNRDSGQREQTWSQWWASWWSDDSQNSQGGADRLLHQHDGDDNGYLTRRELPPRMQDEFEQVDRNEDGYLSRTEIRNHGETLRQQSSRGTSQASRRTRQGSSGEQSWSQWWNSWFEEQSRGDQRQEDVAASGAREFIRRHDDNGDGHLVRSELPARMHDDFDRLDGNNDSFLIRTEIEQHARQSSSSSSGSERLSDGRKPVELTYVWVIDANQGAVSRDELQEAYELLARIDENGDQQISSSELRQRREQLVSDWCQSHFQQLDRNQDDRLTQEEAGDSTLADQFERFDRNEDGSLTKSEVEQTIEERFASHDSSETRR